MAALRVKELTEDIDYPASDGKPMAETGFHLTVILYVIGMLRTFFRQRADVYVGGDMLMYYEQGNPRNSVAPDVFVVFDVPNHERRSWFSWREGKAPDVVFEITSKGTRDEDERGKKELYTRLGIKEYFLFDPLDEYLRPRLQGFRLVRGRFQLLLWVSGQLASAQLGLTIQAADQMLDLRDQQTGKRLLSPVELAEALDKENASRREAEAEIARLRLELARAPPNRRLTNRLANGKSR